ncbi:MAG: cation:proton antiporter regulatory subunit [Anaerolineales bacterium]
MKNVIETTLPGVGIRHDFRTNEGSQLGVLTHHTGRRDFIVYDEDDPDTCKMIMRLEVDESQALSEMLGGAHYTPQTGQFQQTIGGMTIDWVPIHEGWVCAGRSIRDVGVKASDISIVAVIRDEVITPAPAPEFRLMAGDTAVVVGTPESIRHVFSLLQGSTPFGE